MGVRHKHSSWAPGAKKFWQWLRGIPGVREVSPGNMRASHVKSGEHRVGIAMTPTSVQVSYYAQGRMQRFFAFPDLGISRKGLARRIRKALRARTEKGGVGQGSKDEIQIPESIRRKMQMVEPIAELAELKVTEQVEKQLRLTEKQAEVYEFLLDFAPSREIESFEVPLVYNKLAVKFGKGSSGALFMFFKKMGVLIPGAFLSSSPGEGKVFTVKRREYEVVSHKSGRKPLSKKHDVDKAREQRVTDRKGTKEDIVTHVEAIKKLLATIRRHVEVLEQRGFSVVLDGDKVVLQYK